MCVVYVDDLIFQENNEVDIHDIVIKFQGLGVDLEQEYDDAGFLGVTLDRDDRTGLLEMKPVRLIK